ncbi:hypothetical protein PFICI_11817 [Pestalotiopsis fici W106-1]|uniref:LysM domain-containing protein n=1 Tax=Pestalotiopsis fici (strain W106-1 / CGMCC3.15140) TaxID=1229662 RepID=W3WRD7_PESFW|nr:uncharacterized protein PFICI_11817 [Pestalotiopsis fici W106-1]ETS76430.1 hypothetical protein PFICI_11817 [Pestalotiopsis fici W106-1]
MFFQTFLASIVLVGATWGYTVDPPTAASSDTIQDCTLWMIASTGDTCQGISNTYGLELSQLFTYNPSLASACAIVVGQSYCVEQNWGVPPETPTTSKTTTTAAPTTTGNGVSTPTPTMGGLTSNCNKFYFVPKGSSCKAVLDTNGITIAQLYAWNTDVLADCTGLWAEVYVCVGIIGETTTPNPTTSATTTTTTTPGNGVTTPTPTQPGMVSNCQKFYFVSPGTSCSAVLAANSITLADLYAYNSGVGADCSGMWASVYVCVGVIGGGQVTTTSTTTSIPPTTTTTPGNGVSTPTPTQPGMVSNCDKFFFVQPGTSCSAVLSSTGLTLAQLYALNSGVGADCSVVSGDTCSVVSTKTGVSTANIIAWNPQAGSTCNIWLGYYICVGI